MTGASRGMGAATGRRFVAEGCGVVVADVLREAGELLAKYLGAARQHRQPDTRLGRRKGALATALINAM